MDIRKTKYYIKFYGVASFILFCVYYLFDLRVFKSWDLYVPFMKKLSMSLFLIALIFLVSHIVIKLISDQEDIQGDRYNVVRVIRLFAIAFSLIVVLSFLFQNLYAAAVSFGLISLVLGFALQAPITSFIAWIYLVFKRTYLVGDRIQVKGFRGDVVSISYLDTTILECNGDYLGSDRSSGRIVRFPNSLVLREEVINYSGPDMPFMWHEVPLQIAYTSDLQFVEETLLLAANRDFEEQYPALAEVKNEQWDPTVYFRINSFAWMEAVITYPVEPKDTAARRNRILKHALPILNSEPERVQFPEGTHR